MRVGRGVEVEKLGFRYGRYVVIGLLELIEFNSVVKFW